MKICFLAAANSIHSIRWIRFFVERGDEVIWISLAPPSDEAKPLLKKVSFYEISPSPLADINGWKAFRYLPAAVKKVKLILKKEKPSVMHIHSVGTYGLVGALSGFKKTIMTPWGSDILLTNKVKKLVIKQVLKQAVYFTCDGENTRSTLIQLGVSAEKISLIRFGTDTDLYENKTVHHQRKEIIVTSLRGLEPVYNIQLLIRAATLVVKENPHIHLNITGKGSLETSLKLLTTNLGLASHVQFLGALPAKELPQLLHSSDIYVSTSTSDSGLASSTAEAMASSLPVIVTDVGDNHLWVEEGKGGYLVATDGVEALAKAILKLAHAPELRRKMGEHNRAIIVEKNNYKKEMQKVADLYMMLT